MCIEPPRPLRAAVDAAEQLRHHVLRRRAAHERVAVRAVGRDQVVVLAQRPRAAHDRRLLADRQVQEAADLRPRVHLARALLEAADQRHRLQPLARVARAGCGQGAASRASVLHGTPARDELLRLQLRQVRAQRPRELRRRVRRAVPEQHHFAAVDLHHLDVVDARRVGQQRRRAPAARDDQAVGVARPSSSACTARGRSPRAPPSPLCAAACECALAGNTRSPTTTAGTSSTPASRAPAVVLRASRSATSSAAPRRAAPPPGASRTPPPRSARSRGPPASARPRTPGGTPPARTAPRGRSTPRTWPRASPASCRTGTARGQRSGCRSELARAALDLCAERVALGRSGTRRSSRRGSSRREHRPPLAPGRASTCRMRSAARYASGLARSK